LKQDISSILKGEKPADLPVARYAVLGHDCSYGP